MGFPFKNLQFRTGVDNRGTVQNNSRSDSGKFEGLGFRARCFKHCFRIAVVRTGKRKSSLWPC